jgi:hypothetical protein
MPYIKEEQRTEILESGLQNLLSMKMDAGQLNWTISRLIHQQLIHRGVRYAHVNEMIGVLECAKLELYRMIAGPYEDIKSAENGPVSGLDRVPIVDDPMSGSRTKPTDNDQIYQTDNKEPGGNSLGWDGDYVSPK